MSEKTVVVAIWAGVDAATDRFFTAKEWLVQNEIEFWNSFPAYCDPSGRVLEKINDEEAMVRTWEVHLFVEWTFSDPRDAIAFKLRWI